MKRKFEEEKIKPVITEGEEAITHQLLGVHLLSVTIVYSIKQSNAVFSQFVVFGQIEHCGIMLHTDVVEVLPGIRLVLLGLQEILQFSEADDWTIEQTSTEQSLVFWSKITGV